LTGTAASIVSQLMTVDPEKRLGANGVEEIK
jgi:hypothetical protein